MDNKQKIYCNNCKNITHHKTLKEIKRSWSDEDFCGYDNWAIKECLGCQTVCFTHVSSCDEDRDFETGEILEKIAIFPERKFLKMEIKNRYNTPFNVQVLYKETLSAYNNNLQLLCAAGLRAIIEAICASEGITDGIVQDKKKGKEIRKKNLEGKINGLAEKGILTKKQANILHQQRFLGNQALHEFLVSSEDTLKIAIEIIEHVLDDLYEIDGKIEIMESLMEVDTRRNRRFKK